MGKDKKERQEKRLQEISLLRTIPYSDHQRYISVFSPQFLAEFVESIVDLMRNMKWVEVDFGGSRHLLVEPL